MRGNEINVMIDILMEVWEDKDLCHNMHESPEMKNFLEESRLTWYIEEKCYGSSSEYLAYVKALEEIQALRSTYGYNFIVLKSSFPFKSKITDIDVYFVDKKEALAFIDTIVRLKGYKVVKKSHYAIAIRKVFNDFIVDIDVHFGLTVGTFRYIDENSEILRRHLKDEDNVIAFLVLFSEAFMKDFSISLSRMLYAIYSLYAMVKSDLIDLLLIAKYNGLDIIVALGAIMSAEFISSYKLHRVLLNTDLFKLRLLTHGQTSFLSRQLFKILTKNLHKSIEKTIARRRGLIKIPLLVSLILYLDVIFSRIKAKREIKKTLAEILRLPSSRGLGILLNRLTS